MKQQLYKTNIIQLFLYIQLTLSILIMTSGCSFLLLDNKNIYNPKLDKTNSLLIVVDETCYPAINDSLNQYIDDLKNNHCSTYVITFSGDTPMLKNLLKNYYLTNKINGAFLIGNLPASWYEMTSFNEEEQFPCDLYLMDFDAEWLDKNNNGIYDGYSQKLNLDIYTSRIMGTDEEINNYLHKVHSYRMKTLTAEPTAYIFKDDDWANYNKGDFFGLNTIYTNITVCDLITDTIKDNYINEMTLNTVEYVYQWIHARPYSLYVKENTIYNQINLSDISQFNFKGLFYNLFNCSASRFTEKNIAMEYLMKTQYTLATIGSTKVGGNYFPYPFNVALSNHGTWGDAFKFWYNTFGNTDDKWFFGMMILGDPTLTLNKQEYVFFDFGTRGPPEGQNQQNLNQIFNEIDFYNH